METSKALFVGPLMLLLTPLTSKIRCITKFFFCIFTVDAVDIKKIIPLPNFSLLFVVDTVDIWKSIRQPYLFLYFYCWCCWHQKNVTLLLFFTHNFRLPLLIHILCFLSYAHCSNFALNMCQNSNAIKSKRGTVDMLTFALWNWAWNFFFGWTWSASLISSI